MHDQLKVPMHYGCLTSNTVPQNSSLPPAGIAIGGDVFPGSTLSDHCLRYENIPQIKLIVVLGELGGQDEYSLVRHCTSSLEQLPHQHACAPRRECVNKAV